MFNEILLNETCKRIDNVLAKVKAELKHKHEGQSKKLVEWLTDFKGMMETCQAMFTILSEFSIPHANDEVLIYLSQMATTQLTQSVQNFYKRFKFKVPLEKKPVMSPEVEDSFLKLLNNNAASVRALSNQNFEKLKNNFKKSLAGLIEDKDKLPSYVRKLNNRETGTDKGKCEEAFNDLKIFCETPPGQIPVKSLDEMCKIFDERTKRLYLNQHIIFTQVFQIGESLSRATKLLKDASGTANTLINGSFLSRLTGIGRN